jgi:hypothetical protein
VAWDQHLIAEPEGPSFITYSCASPFGPATLVTHDAKRTWVDEVFRKGCVGTALIAK